MKKVATIKPILDRFQLVKRPRPKLSDSARGIIKRADEARAKVWIKSQSVYYA